ncbi:glycosyltransferase family 2 protein [Patescibacteria group bacterium]
MAKLSVVINTFNEAEILPRAINSVKDIAYELVVCDMQSLDKTAQIARKLGAKVYSHKKEKYVELVRNLMTTKASGDWVLILDPDEEVSSSLAKKIKEILNKPLADYYRLPRKNIIFGKWLTHTNWWPDYQIRLFRKGFVSWQDEIHSFPITKGKGADIELKEALAIVHHNYENLAQYMQKMLRYTSVQSEELLKSGYVFRWQDLVNKPINEFLGRFFEGEGFKDGVHGLALSLLQSFSELVVYLNVWEKQGNKTEKISKKDLKKELLTSVKAFKWWIGKKLSWLSYLKFR